MASMKIINLTPHDIVVKGMTFPKTGNAIRLTTSYSVPDPKTGFVTKTVTNPVLVTPEGELPLPPERKNTYYIVSGVVLSALKGQRNDLVAPATGHPDVVRNEAGHIVSVPHFEV